MRNFVRALGYSRPYAFRLGLSMAAALAVGALWFLNLSAMYPILKIMSEGYPNLQTWVQTSINDYDEVVRKSQNNVQLMTARIEQLTALVNAGQDNNAYREQLIRDRRALATEEARLADINSKLWRLQQLSDLVIRHLPSDNFQTFVMICLAVFVGMLLKGFFEFWQEYLVGGVVCQSLLHMRNRFFQATLRLAPSQVREVGTAELMARVTNDVEQVGTGMKILFGKMVVEPIKMFGCIFGACYISWQLTLLFLFLVAPAVFTLARVSRKMKKATRRVLERMSGLYKIVRETFDSVRVVTGFTNEPTERKRFRRATTDFYKRSVRVITLDAITGPIVEVLGFLAVSTALLASAYLVMKQRTDIFGIKMLDEPMSLATLITLYGFLGMIADPVRRLSSVYNKIQVGAAAADRIYFVQDKVATVTANAMADAVPVHSKSIEFLNVCFSYVPGAVPGTLNSVTLKVNAGETIAIVGPNGCGKSTLLGLIPRYYDPDHGAVFVDGVNIRHARLRSLRRQVGIVTQDTMLFDDTISANIAYGKPGATPAEIEAAARQAQAHEFILEKPLGYAEPVGDGGTQLSGGQRQRIALARAILRDPRILILDEFTSQIDADSESKIHAALRQFVRGRTTFLITHRMSTLELADRIVVMDAGHIEAVGTHAELYPACTVYRRLIDAQSAPDTLRLSGEAA